MPFTASIRNKVLTMSSVDVMSIPPLMSDDTGLRSFYIGKIEELQILIRDKVQNLERLKAQRNELNSKVRLMREELTHLHEPGSYVGEVIKPMGKLKVLVKVNPEGKYVVDIDKDIDINKCTPNTRVALKSDSYTLHKILPTKVDPLVSLMKVQNFSCHDFRKLFHLFEIGREST